MTFVQILIIIIVHFYRKGYKSAKMCIFFKEKDNGVLLNIKAVPNSSKNEICGVMENALKVKIKAPAVENKANLELVKYFSKLLKVPKSSISLASGSTSKIKSLYIDGCTIEQIKSFCDSIGLDYN